ncbi:tripartite tricarboxylate transporter TctB family protein [Salinicoccus sp. YB14-2]|uniref:tripartite tricarboxylate transporter TctB family protein n=1 Tax=Salinicoccus sp. YB14-2 TaxID=1572701 RepID=UPI00068F4138|nr:tripartite tricarboxylate transporter TctB family protein [Salinicoccus sp. YB14-2]
MSTVIKDITLAIILILFSIIGFIASNSFADEADFYGPAFFPRLIFILLFVFAIMMVLESILKRKLKVEEQVFSKKMLLNALLLILTIFGYILLFNFIGFLISSILFLFASQVIFNVKNKIMLIGVSVVIPFILYFIFSNLFNIPLP